MNRLTATFALSWSVMSLAAAVNDPATVAKDSAAPGSAIPQPYPAARYQASWQKNPFLLKTAPIAQARESWATDWSLASIAEIGGEFRVSIRNKKTGEYRRIYKDKAGEFSLVSVNLQRDRKSSSAELSKAGETATLTYDQTAMAPAPRGANPAVPGSGARVPVPTVPTAPGQPVTAQVKTGVAPGGGRFYPTQSPVPNPGGVAAGAFQRPTAGASLNPNLPPGMAGSAIPRSTAAGVAGGTPAVVNGVNMTVPTVGATAVPGQTYSPGIVPGAVASPNITYPAVPTPSSRRRQLVPAPLTQASPQ